MQITVNQNIDIKFKIKNTCYGVTAKGDIFNLKTNRKLRKIVIGLTKGYCISGKFTSLSVLRNLLVKIEIKEECPF